MHLLLARGQGRPDVSLFGERAMATGDGGAGDAVFPQGFTDGCRAFRTVDWTAGGDEIGHVQCYP